MPKKELYPHSGSLEIYTKLIASIADVERKGATMPYTSVNGNMFSFLDDKGSLGLRLPEKERNIFLKKYNTVLCEAHGAVLKEYVLVPMQIFTSHKEMITYFTISYKYALTLKSKSSNKSNK